MTYTQLKESLQKIDDEVKALHKKKSRVYAEYVKANKKCDVGDTVQVKDTKGGIHVGVVKEMAVNMKNGEVVVLKWFPQKNGNLKRFTKELVKFRYTELKILKKGDLF